MTMERTNLQRVRLCAICRRPIISTEGMYKITLSTGNGRMQTYEYHDKDCRDTAISRAYGSDEIIILENYDKSQFDKFMSVVVVPSLESVVR